MMVKIGTRVAMMNIAFSTSRNGALNERKMLQYTIFSMKPYHCALIELKFLVFILPDILACLSIPCTEQKIHSNPDFLTKSDSNTLQACINIAFEFPQALKLSAGVINYLCFSLHQCKRAG